VVHGLWLCRSNVTVCQRCLWCWRLAVFALAAVAALAAGRALATVPVTASLLAGLAHFVAL
jgi:hypothetical protein